ncbi:DNA polymerase delta catalytic subunit [Cucumispora dikerogammari]|nr:DNA polymerase delta catalytic subunit [Cucumispora dikerogammari]
MALKLFNTHISSPTPFEIVMHGNLPSGRSVQVNIPNYELYFYIKTAEIHPKITKALCSKISEAIQSKDLINFIVKKVEVVNKTNIYGYFLPENFIKISYKKNEKTNNKFSSANKVKEFLEGGVPVSSRFLEFNTKEETELHSKNTKVSLKFITFEHSVAPVTRFMTDRKINGMQYIEISNYTILHGEDILREEVEHTCICGNINYDFFNPDICNELIGFVDYNEIQDKCKNQKCKVFWGNEKTIETEEISSSMLSVCHKHELKFPESRRLFIETSDEYVFPTDDVFFPPFKVMSYDIETPSETRVFSHPSVVEIKQIGITLKIDFQNKGLHKEQDCKYCKDFNKKDTQFRQINKSNTLEIQTIFTFGSIKRLNATNVFSFERERDLLASFFNYVKFIDPDVITGYNINDFDTWFIDERCKLLKLPFDIGRKNIIKNITDDIPQVIGLTITRNNDSEFDPTSSFLDFMENKNNEPDNVFSNCGKDFEDFLKSKYIIGKGLNFRRKIKQEAKKKHNIFHECVKVKQATFSSVQMGSRDLNLIDIHGRINFDLIVSLRKTHNLSSYALNAVSSHFLKAQKLDIDHNMVFDMMVKNPTSRTRVAKYCLQDTVLPLRIFNKLSVLISSAELVRVCGIPLEYHLTRGISIKVFHLLLRKANEMGFILPDIARKGGKGEDTYEGAIVIEPERGFYEEPVAVLDFASLYPSIIIANNLCYSTFLGEDRIKKGLNFEEPAVDLANVKTLKLYDSEKRNKMEDKLNGISLDKNPVSLQNAGTSAMFYKKFENEDRKSLDTQEKYLVNLFSANIDGECIEFCITPSNNHFVTKKHRLGILPRVLTDLLTERKAVKHKMNNTKDPQLREILNARQNALKQCANSIYGFTGASIGQLPNLNISASVTAFGREMIEMTKFLSETILKREGYNARVIYGDTDSVMIKVENFFSDKNLQSFYNSIKNTLLSSDYKKYEGDKFFSKECECDDHLIDEKPDLNSLAVLFRICKSLSAEISTHFLDPIKLEFEKVYWPYLLMAKKRYAGVMYCGREVKECKVDYSQFKEYREKQKTIENKYYLKSLNYLSKECFNNVKINKVDTKGIETVRRDNCKLVRIVLEKCLDLLLLKKDVYSACKLVKSTVADLYANKVDLSLLIITKQLSKANYTNVQPHVVLAEKMKKRDPGTAPGLGDRVPFVIIRDPVLSAAASAGRIKTSRDIKVCDKAEDPLYVLENDLQVDVDYYIEQQLSKPIHRLFSSICDTSKLLVNEGNIEIKKTTIKKSIFGSRKDVCLECKKSGSILCVECIKKGNSKITNFQVSQKYVAQEVNTFSLESTLTQYNKVEDTRSPSETYDKHSNKIKQELEQEKTVYAKCWAECQRCFGDRMNKVLCTNRDCDIFFMRVKAGKEIKSKEKTLEKMNKLDW